MLRILATATALVFAAASSTPPPPGHTCGNEGGSSTTVCSVPPWPATWQMNASTIIMPCNYTSFQEPSTTAGWGIVDFDWSNSLKEWSAATPMDNDERQLMQVNLTKSASVTAEYTKIWLYRNTVYGYPWFTSVRTILDDPDYADWFLMFSGKGNYTSPACDHNYDPPKCTEYFHTQMDTPLPTTTWGPEGRPIGGYGQCFPKDNKSGCDCGTKPCGFYVFNHSSTAVINGQSFQDWWLDSYMFNEVGSSPLVHGFYWDDTWTPQGVGDDPEPGMIEDMGLTTNDLLQLTASFNANMDALRNRTLREGKFAWQLLTYERVRAGPALCTADLENYCKPDAAPQAEAMMYPTSMLYPPFTNCSVFGCTCKGAADYYGIDGGWGCAPQEAQQWWIHEAKPCASPTSCCTVDDYTKNPPPYPGCAHGPAHSNAVDVANFLLIRGDYAWLGEGWQGCAQPPADAGGGYPFPSDLNRDFGTPLGVCKQAGGSPGVFKREFTKAIVQMDCNTGTPTITMQ
jgi:hypothetical protein